MILIYKKKNELISVIETLVKICIDVRGLPIVYKFMYNIWMLILSSPFQDPYGWLVNLINKVGTTLYVFVRSSSCKLYVIIFLYVLSIA